MYFLYKEYKMKSKLLSINYVRNFLCTTCSRNSLRERAQSERLQILGERLRRVRGPGVRHSLIPIISLHIPSPSSLPYHPFNSTSVHINFSPAQRTIHSSCSSSRWRRPTTIRGSLVLVPLLPSYSWKRCLCTFEAELFEDDPLKLLSITSS